MPPEMGVGSIFQSPVWTTVPMGVLMAKATASAMEWLTWINSTWNTPARITSPASQVWISVVESRLCSASLSSTRPAVIRVV